MQLKALSPLSCEMKGQCKHKQARAPHMGSFEVWLLQQMSRVLNEWKILNKRFSSKPPVKAGLGMVPAGKGDGRGEQGGKEMVSSPKRGCAQDSQLSNCMMHVCTSMGKFFRSMGQARVSVILRREESTGNAKQRALPGAEPLRHPGLPAGWCLARDTPSWGND